MYSEQAGGIDIFELMVGFLGRARKKKEDRKRGLLGGFYEPASLAQVMALLYNGP